MTHKQHALTEGMKKDLQAMWKDGQRELVILTFKMATVVGDADVARWIHTTFSEQYTDAELNDLTEFAMQVITMRVLAASDAKKAEQAAADAISRAMQH